ncbi:MAG: glycoside hydrolase [Bacteroidales bacterium]|nr:glycoside hydrolase [Bacteroidales bacterium]
MNKTASIATALIACCSLLHAQEKISNIISQDGERWYGAYTAKAFNGTPLDQIVFQPYPEEYATKDLRYDNNSNQAAPLLISNRGRYLWSDYPFAFSFHEGNIRLVSDHEVIQVQQSEGTTLRHAYLAAMQTHFPPSGKTPAEELFTMPQYNTWIELNYHQSQTDVLHYAEAIVKNHFPSGVFMIDDQWCHDYGSLDFEKTVFPDAKAMVAQLHDMGFKVMVWVSPFITLDSPQFRQLRDLDALVKVKGTDDPARVRWWNGYSACLDLTKESALNWFKGKLRALQTIYGIDGFKMDAVDFDFYTSKSPVFSNDDTNTTPQAQCEAYTRLAAEFPLSELRASWKGGNVPVSQRLQDKSASWDDLKLIIPDMVSAGLIGYTFTCPDMIGGGLLGTFDDIEHFDQEMFIRSAQAQVMMPMMQFSVAPWRILDARHLAICQQMADLHKSFGPEIMAMARQSATDGEPIVRHMEYQFPGQGFESCNDQYVLGGKYIVAPMLNPGTIRSVKLPKGTWIDEQGKKYRGGRSYIIEVQLERLPYFTRQ